MNKKQYCETHEAIAYYSGLSGLYIHGFGYGIETHAYCGSGNWNGNISYHRVKVYEDMDGTPYITIHGYKMRFDDFIRIRL